MSHTAGLHLRLLRQHARWTSCTWPRTRCSRHRSTNSSRGWPSCRSSISPARSGCTASRVDVQGYLVEKLSGKPFPDFVRERIFVPLGMKDTEFFVPPDKLARLATVYARSRGHGSLPGRAIRTSASRRGCLRAAAACIRPRRLPALRADAARTAASWTACACSRPAPVALMRAISCRSALRPTGKFGIGLQRHAAGLGFGYDVAVFEDPHEGRQRRRQGHVPVGRRGRHMVLGRSDERHRVRRHDPAHRGRTRPAGHREPVARWSTRRWWRRPDRGPCSGSDRGCAWRHEGPSRRLRRPRKRPEPWSARSSDGDLFASPRRPSALDLPWRHSVWIRSRHPVPSSGRGGPGGWGILDEPELHFGRRRARAGSRGLAPRTHAGDARRGRSSRSLPTGSAKCFRAVDRRRSTAVQEAPSTPRAGWARLARRSARRTVEVLRPEAGQWTSVTSYGEDQIIKAEPFDAVEIDLLPVWGESRG